MTQINTDSEVFMNRDPETFSVIGAAMEVHREVILPIYYKGVQLAAFYKADFICFRDLVVEIKALAQISNVEAAQVINYLKAAKRHRGLLLNFGATRLEYKRFVYG